MKMHEIAKKLGLECLTRKIGGNEEADVTGAHASDLLSDVLANAPAGGVLVTIQVHMNTIAVAVHAGLSGVILASGRRPEAPVILKAEEENIPLYLAKEGTFDVAGRLYEIGFRGGRA